MSANIEFNKLRGTYSSYTVKQPAWHGLGITKPDYAKTSREVIEAANLDFNVLKGQIYGEYARPIFDRTTGEQLLTAKIPNTMFTYREDTGLVLTKDAHMVTNAYEVVQNIEAFDFFDSIVEEGVAEYETAGVLGNGEIIFVSAKLPRINLVNDDKIDQYLLFTMRHDGTGAVNLLFTPIRVVCNNTLVAALGSQQKLSFKHTKNVKEKIEFSKTLLGILPKQRNNTTAIYNTMIESKVRDENQVHEYIANVFLKPDEFVVVDNRVLLTDNISTRKINQVASILNYTLDGIGQDPTNVYGLFNGITGYLQNVKYDDKMIGKNMSTELKEKIFMNSVFGDDKKLREVAIREAFKVMELNK